ncbi:CDP-glycerol glycerophosphotransferase family protein [Vibrio breoganii]|uniref:CDP-glycerol glycerophosphotransferase family protein n=1 Tax=Vibrio breoganii TaxID=553239 RepID=UPI000C85FCAC|nr:CDP-glycerol glycerophosphotransferase family protein [Vibrio breoganii]PMK79552.1 hypothetical protein BCT94_18790 [Vibrio breoganii]
MKSKTLNKFNKMLSALKIAYRKAYEYTASTPVNKLKYGNYDVVFYMSGGTDSKYQYDMWVPIISEMVGQGIKVVTVFRSLDAYNSIETVDECAAYIRKLDDLVDFYRRINISVVLYPNNRMKCFQSLSYTDAHHIFINHGESEKSSMYSNQTKAYDTILVAGNVAKQRYIDNLHSINPDNYVIVGRPQLDFIESVDLDIPNNSTVVLYAPTWEGTHAEMNYSSIGSNALDMIRSLISNENYFVIYKPHPSLGSESTAHKNFHQKIISTIQTSSNGVYIESGDINSLFHQVDYAVFDNSSVVVDYLSFEKPYCIIDKFSVDKNKAIPKIADIKNVLIQEENLSDLADNIISLIENFDYNEQKNVKIDYLGEFKTGESTGRVLEFVISKINHTKYSHD